MVNSCSPSSIRKAKKRIESAAITEYLNKIIELKSRVDSLSRYLSRRNIQLDMVRNRFIDEDGRIYPINKLASVKHMKQYIEREGSGFVESVMEAANDLINLKNFLDSKISPEAIENVMNKIRDACLSRTAFIERHGDIASRITGVYQSRACPYLEYLFSNSVDDIFMKSTGRPWSEQNCERYGGSRENGIYSDIAHNSVVVFIRDIKTKNVIARLMLRHCIIDGTGESTFGHDIYWYRGHHSHDRHTVIETIDVLKDGYSLKALQATNEVVEIIKNAGLKTDFDTCTTPYMHMGYSDVERGPEKRITYPSGYAYCTRCGVVKADRDGNPLCFCNRFYTCQRCYLEYRYDEMAVIDPPICQDCYHEDEDEEYYDEDEEYEDEE